MKKSKTRNIDARGERNVAGEKIDDSTIVTGDENFVGNEFGGDNVGGNKTIYINPPAISTASVLHQLRAPVRDFVGREQEIKTLSEALLEGRHAGINGMGGLGKTELALLVAEHVADTYPDAQFFINLQGTDAKPRPPEEVLANCIRAFLGPEAQLPDDRDQLLQLYRNALSGKRVLLLLDNALDSGQVQPLLPPPGSVVLVTSRQAVVLPGMMRLKLNPLTEAEAQKMLLEIAPHADAAAPQIAQLCGYLPLAIRAAASLLAVTDDLDPVDYVTQLKDERGRLERIGKEGVEIDVAASFNLSYERLTPEAAHVFRFLSVFPGTFDAVAEQAICADPGHAQLSELLRRSLVLYDSDTKRYRLHDLARLFVDSKMSVEEWMDGHKQHAVYYKAVLGQADELYGQGGTAMLRGLALFDLERSNIEAGQSWVAAQGVDADEYAAELGFSYADSGLYVLNLRLPSRVFIRWLEIALVAARHLKNRGDEGYALGNMGAAYSDLGDHKQAIQFYEQALTIARETGNRRNEGALLGNLGVAYSDLGDNQRAIQSYEQALTIAREVENRREEGNTLLNLGASYLELRDTQRAIQFFDDTLLIIRGIGDRRCEGVVLDNLGLAYSNLRETQRALQFYEEALVIRREIGDRRGEATTLWHMSQELQQLGKRRQAIEYAEQALSIREKMEDPGAAKVRAALDEWRGEAKSD